MNFDQYFKGRSDLVEKVLLDRSAGRPIMRDWRLYGAGIACIIGAMLMEFLAARSIIDPGFFARISAFLTFMLIAGTWLLSMTQGADLILMRVAIKSRDMLIEKALSQLLRVDGAIAHRLAPPRG